jgi:hypothetical protein
MNVRTRFSISKIASMNGEKDENIFLPTFARGWAVDL